MQECPFLLGAKSRFLDHAITEPMNGYRFRDVSCIIGRWCHIKVIDSVAFWIWHCDLPESTGHHSSPLAISLGKQTNQCLVLATHRMERSQSLISQSDLSRFMIAFLFCTRTLQANRCSMTDFCPSSGIVPELPLRCLFT
jgi:hypothetical protein